MELTLDLNRIKAERIAKGLTQEQMAEAMGLSNGSAYAKRESGSIDFGVNEFAKYCSVLGFDNQKLNIFFKLNVPDWERNQIERRRIDERTFNWPKRNYSRNKFV